MKVSIATLLISLILCSALVDITNAAVAPSPAQSAASSGFCDNKCSVRCALKGRDSRCVKYCMMCCDKCRCVPSGTSGHLDECPCYRDWKSPTGRPKCP